MQKKIILITAFIFVLVLSIGCTKGQTDSTISEDAGAQTGDELIAKYWDAMINKNLDKTLETMYPEDVFKEIYLLGADPKEIEKLKNKVDDAYQSMKKTFIKRTEKNMKYYGPGNTLNSTQFQYYQPKTKAPGLQEWINVKIWYKDKESSSGTKIYWIQKYKDKFYLRMP